MIIDYDKIYELCEKHGRDGRSGAVSFRPGFKKLICNELGVDMKLLSRAGWADIRGSAIEIYAGRNGFFRSTPEHYYQ